MLCVDCGADLSARWDHHAHPYLCASCAYARHLKSCNDRTRRMRYGPNRAEFLRVERERVRGKRASRILEVVVCATEGCDNTFEMNRIGRRRKFCRSCAAFYGGYRDLDKYVADRVKRRAA